MAIKQQNQPRKRIRRGKLAELFCVNIRTIDGWAKRGVIPAPHYMPGSRIPLWFEDQIPNLKDAS
jgi:phage terminase Nu1 subunit (DNA packaging protein)